MELGEKHARAVSIQTTFATVEGRLASSGMLRLLDDLNLVARTFLTVHEPVFLTGPWSRGDETVSLNKASVLFVKELPGCPPPAENRRVSNRFTRAPVELLMEQYTLHGFLHVPPGGDPMTRLNQPEHSFVALTSASVMGPTEEFVAPFLAVNPNHVLAARRIESPQPVVAIDADETELAAPLDDPTGL